MSDLQCKLFISVKKNFIFKMFCESGPWSLTLTKGFVFISNKKDILESILESIKNRVLFLFCTPTDNKTKKKKKWKFSTWLPYSPYWFFPSASVAVETVSDVQQGWRKREINRRQSHSHPLRAYVWSNIWLLFDTYMCSDMPAYGLRR